MAAAFFSLVAAAPATAASLVVEVSDAGSSPFRDVVVYAVSEGRKPAAPAATAVMDQKNRMFVPHILPIQTGTAVHFPNSDDVRHQVYSFSPAKKFQLPLYAGTPASPVVFDKPGVVTLGCNIHDRMSAYIVVLDTPYFAVAQAGRAELSGLAQGEYEVHVWHPGLRGQAPSERVSLAGGDKKTIALRIGSK